MWPWITLTFGLNPFLVHPPKFRNFLAVMNTLQKRKNKEVELGDLELEPEQEREQEVEVRTEEVKDPVVDKEADPRRRIRLRIDPPKGREMNQAGTFQEEIILAKRMIDTTENISGGIPRTHYLPFVLLGTNQYLLIVL